MSRRVHIALSVTAAMALAACLPPGGGGGRSREAGVGPGLDSEPPASDGRIRPPPRDRGVGPDAGPRRPPPDMWIPLEDAAPDGPNCYPEDCNGVDDDCDGRIDESFFDEGLECPERFGVCTVWGTLACFDGELFCDAVMPDVGPERCNGEDDDCDGDIDEQAVDVGVDCVVDFRGCELPGVTSCDFAELICEPVGAPPPERCNGRDDDCDGDIDEAVPEVGEYCDTLVDDGRCWGEGTLQCRQAALECDVDRVIGDAETCNGVDDDCDGRVDEAAVEVGAQCQSGIGACMRRGETACVAGEAVCDAVPGAPEPERCNDVDDDCDHVSDEGGVCDVDPGGDDFEGIQTQLAVAVVEARGFRLCHQSLYQAEFDFREMMDDCDGRRVLLGCRRTDAPQTLVVAAAGDLGQVFLQVPCGLEEAHEHNGARWYLSPNCSFGFAPLEGTLQRNTCDVAEDRGAERLCWHTTLSAGYRCGATRGLNNSAVFERVLYVRP